MSTKTCHICDQPLGILKNRVKVGTSSDGGIVCGQCLAALRRDGATDALTFSAHTTAELRSMLSRTDKGGAAYLQQALGGRPIEAVVDAGHCVAGMPTPHSPDAPVRAVFYDDTFNLITADAPPRVLGSVAYGSIRDVTVEDRTTVAGRMATGPAVFSGLSSQVAKQMLKNESHFVACSIAEGRFSRDLVFAFEGPGSGADAEALRSAIIRHANAAG